MLAAPTSAGSPTGTGSRPGTAPHHSMRPPADQKRHRLSRAGEPPIYQALHIMAVVQLRNATEGRTYFDAKKPPARPRWKRCARENEGCPTSSTRRWWPTRNDEKRRAREGTRGRLQSSVTDLTPDIGSSDKPLPELRQQSA